MERPSASHDIRYSAVSPAPIRRLESESAGRVISATALKWPHGATELTAPIFDLPSATLRYDRQYDVRRVLFIMVYGLFGDL